MRFLLLLPWCFVFLRAETPCDWKIPTAGKECVQYIQWKAHDEKQATATCREYFATTFVEGIIDPSDNTKVKCTVSRQFECNHIDDTLKPVAIFDKCYTFSNAEVSIDTYLANPSAYCKAGGGIPVFFTMTQAKHIAEKAHREDIFKIWVNIHRNAHTIEASPANDFPRYFLLYKEPWKTHEETYWEGETLKKTPTYRYSNDEKRKVVFVAPPGVEYMFFRTRTDYVHNLYQGSFERADKDAKASIVCEYKAKIVPDQDKYCGKVKALGLNAKYDESRNRKRCVYTSLSTYSLAGTEAAIKNFPGCKEKPSVEHLTGLDDGTAQKEVYNDLTTKGTYRVAAIKVDTKIYVPGSEGYEQKRRLHCDPTAASLDSHREPYAIFDHSNKIDFSRKMTSPWEKNYPKDECSDFPSPSMDSNTLAIKSQQIIDVPVPVRFQAICSIETNVDCILHNPCRADQICMNVDSWNPDTKHYVKCRCPFFHKDDDTKTKCIWNTAHGDICGKMHAYDKNIQDIDPNISGNKWGDVPIKNGQNIWSLGTNNEYSDNVDAVSVRQGCTMTIWSHPPTTALKENFPLLSRVKYGEHVVPNDKAGTLNGWQWEMSASAVDCSCDFSNI